MTHGQRPTARRTWLYLAAAYDPNEEIAYPLVAASRSLHDVATEAGRDAALRLFAQGYSAAGWPDGDAVVEQAYLWLRSEVGPTIVVLAVAVDAGTLPVQELDAGLWERLSRRLGVSSE